MQFMSFTKFCPEYIFYLLKFLLLFVLNASVLKLLVLSLLCLNHNLFDFQMVRSYKRKTDWAERPVEQLTKAVEAVQKGQSFRHAAAEFGVTRASPWRAVKKVSHGQKLADLSDQCNTRQVFTAPGETELAQYLLKASRIGFHWTLKP